MDKLATGSVTPIVQAHIDESTLRPAPKIFKQDCLINWDKSAQEIFNFVRGLSPYPAAWCNLTKESGESTTAKIFEVHIDFDRQLAVGAIESDNKSYIAIGCKDGAIMIDSIQLAGKKRLSTKELLLGFKDIEAYKVN